MQLALRPITTAGIALMGAGVIAATPIAPPPVAASTMQVSTASVALTSTVDPLTRWVEVIQTSTTSLSNLADYYMDRPLPIATEVIKNLQTYAGMVATALPATATNLQNWANTYAGPGIQKAIGEMQAGQFEQAAATINTFLGYLPFALVPAMDLLKIPNLMLDHAYSVAKDIVSVTTLANLVNVPLGQLTLAIGALGTSAQGIQDAFETGDIAGGLSGIANIPADLVDNTLNGLGGLINFRRGGTCQCFIQGGAVLNLLIKLPRTIADGVAIPTTAAAALAELPAATDTVVESAPTLAALPPANPTPTGPAASAASANTTAAEPAAAPEDSTTAAMTAVTANSTGTTELSDGTKTETSNAAGTVARPGQQLRSSVQNATDQVDKRVKKLRSDIEKSVKKVSDSISKVGKKKTAASSAASNAAAADKNDKAGSDD
ncbi:hypothetical protein [Mycolicibacterium septicum]|uniref:hypothetical protein n=1 Tax=Mycolicibacterium septicum TaxID=98668 RepID=UPI000414CF48|nr:hypothetical protein [Mycolicibacterium septicum]